MLVRIKNEDFAKDVIAANQNRYTVDGKGEAVVESADADVFYSSGFVKIGEVDPKDHIRMPETPAELLNSCQRLGVTGADLRRMADFLDATNNMGPPEESLEPELLAIVDIPPVMEESDPDMEFDPDPDQHARPVNLGKLNRLSLMKRAKDMGLEVDGRWGKSRLIAAIRSKRDVPQETFNSL